MTGIQALERIAEDKPSKPGLIRCIEYEYERHGTLCLLGAYNVAQGTLIGLVLPQRTEEDFVALIDHIVQEHPEAKGFRFILDNLNTHQSETLVKYIAGKENIDLRWSPMFGHLRGKLSYSGLPIWISISSCTEGQVLAPQLFYFGRRNGGVSMQRNVVKWNTDPGMKTFKSAARAIDLHAAFSLVPSLFPLS